MNERLAYLIQQIQYNAKNLVTVWAILAFVAVPMLLMLVLKIKDLLTFSLLFSFLYWIIVFIIFSYQTKKHFEKTITKAI